MNGRPARRPAALLAGLLLVAATASCTTDAEKGSATSPGTPSGSSRSVPTPASVPLRTEVTHVSGTLPAAGRAALEKGVGRAIGGYLDAAFLTGTYPRSDFDGSFEDFTSGAVPDARRDEALLTNKSFGPTTRSVHATRRTAYLSVLAPRKKVAGVTAAVDLVLAVDRGDDPAEKVHLSGRLLLTRDTSGRWAIFGYDLHRSDTPGSSS